MRQINWKTVSTLVLMGMLVSCSESAVAPSVSPSAGAPVAARFAPQGAPNLLLNGTAAPNTTTTFTVGPQGGIFFAGNTAIVFPANSICDPATSTYGIGTWDDSCTPLSRSIQITAVTRVTSERTQVDFSPSLRFVPSGNPLRWVWLYMSVPSLRGTTDLSAFNIYYAPTMDGPLVDEAATDPTLRTYADPRTGTSLRRIKHFTGWVVSTGRTCGGEGQDACPDSNGTQQQ